MAAAFTTTATTLEGQVLELARQLQAGEQAFNTANPNTPVNNATLTPDLEGQTIAIAINLPIAVSGTGNQLTVAATPYLP
jgi:hypothetical protein